MRDERFYRMTFASVYPFYLQKIERKGRSKEELDTAIRRLTGYDKEGMRAQIEKEYDFETFFAEAPCIHPNAEQIKGTICGVRVESIDDPLVQNVRRLDKLVDELAKGKSLEKILPAD